MSSTFINIRLLWRLLHGILDLMHFILSLAKLKIGTFIPIFRLFQWGIFPCMLTIFFSLRLALFVLILLFGFLLHVVIELGFALCLLFVSFELLGFPIFVWEVTKDYETYYRNYDSNYDKNTGTQPIIDVLIKLMFFGTRSNSFIDIVPITLLLHLIDLTLIELTIHWVAGCIVRTNLWELFLPVNVILLFTII